MKEYRTEISALLFLLISYFLAKGFFFSIDGASFFENYNIKRALISIYEDRNFQSVNEIRTIYIPGIAVALFFYSLFGNPEKNSYP